MCQIPWEEQWARKPAGVPDETSLTVWRRHHIDCSSRPTWAQLHISEYQRKSFTIEFLLSRRNWKNETNGTKHDLDAILSVDVAERQRQRAWANRDFKTSHVSSDFHPIQVRRMQWSRRQDTSDGRQKPRKFWKQSFIRTDYQSWDINQLGDANRRKRNQPSYLSKCKSLNPLTAAIRGSSYKLFVKWHLYPGRGLALHIGSLSKNRHKIFFSYNIYFFAINRS